MNDFGSDDLPDDGEGVNESRADSARRARIVEFVDDAMEMAERLAFEADVARDPVLAREVERARCLRVLISTMPRVAAPESVRRFNDRLIRLPRSAAGAHAVAADLLASAPLRSAPHGLASRILDSIRQERVVVETARARRAYRPTLRLIAPAAIAAALLLGITTWLVGQRPMRPERPASGRTFVFDIVTIRPGITTPDAAASGDPTLVPPRFEAVVGERSRR